jgi:GNAT superfamily N-acetyltransferase
MNLTVVKLTPILVSDYIKFFDNSAFSDGSDFAGCYCTWYHWTDDLEYERGQCSKEGKKHFKKELAEKYIQQGILQGYLAYLDGKVVGWCNVNDRGNYDRLNKKNRPDLWEDFVAADRVKSIVCFVVTPNMRGKGIATALLKTLCEDAKINNYSYVEAYPSVGEFIERNYHGPFSMYEKIGFILQDNRAGETVVRKYL